MKAVISFCERVCENQNVAAHTGGRAVISKKTLHILANRDDWSAHSLCNSIHFVPYVNVM